MYVFGAKSVKLVNTSVFCINKLKCFILNFVEVNYR